MAARRDIRQDISKKITENGGLILSMKETRAGLEDAFIELMDGEKQV